MKELELRGGKNRDRSSRLKRNEIKAEDEKKQERRGRRNSRQ